MGQQRWAEYCQALRAGPAPLQRGQKSAPADTGKHARSPPETRSFGALEGLSLQNSLCAVDEGKLKLCCGY